MSLSFYHNQVKSAVPALVVGTWLLSLVLIILTTATPLEFDPRWLGNIARGSMWGLAFPACGLLARRNGWFRWVLLGVPWLLWSSIVAVEVMAIWYLCQRPRSEWDHTPFWRKAVEPLEWVFANQAAWGPPNVLFRQGKSMVASQLLWERRKGVLEARLAILTPVLPGLRWASCLPQGDDNNRLLDTSWQLVDTASVGMSQDTALQRRVRPWVTGQRHNQQARWQDDWRERRGQPRSDATELLTSATQQGANTLSCVVSAIGSTTESSFWLPPTIRTGHDSYAVYRARDSEDYGPRRLLTIHAQLLFNGCEYPFYLNLANAQTGSFQLAGTGVSAHKWKELGLMDGTIGMSYSSQGKSPATVTITRLDTVRAIVAGTFSGTLHNGTDGDRTVTLAQGRFDFHYRRSEPSE
jgi:hypothetical protein